MRRLNKEHLGSTLDELLKEDGTLEEVRTEALRRVEDFAAADVANLEERASLHFTWRDLLCAGETWKALHSAGRAPSNRPLQPESWLSLSTLATLLLDPIRERFGELQITYGFAGPELTRHISGRIYPSLDQHAASELRNGKPVCPRGGAAVDFFVVNTPSDVVAAWVERELPWDRLYFYGADRPLHLSYSRRPVRERTDMVTGPSGRLVPKTRRVQP